MHLNHDNLYQAKLIVCVMRRGFASEIVEALSKNNRMVISETQAVRSQGASMLPSHWVEMDMLKVIVFPQYADEVFECIFEQAKMSEMEGSYMYQVNVPWATHFELPDVDTLVPTL